MSTWGYINAVLVMLSVVYHLARHRTKGLMLVGRVPIDWLIAVTMMPLAYAAYRWSPFVTWRADIAANFVAISLGAFASIIHDAGVRLQWEASERGRRARPETRSWEKL